MKFSEIQEPSGGFTNNTSSYFLVLGIAETNASASSNISVGVYPTASGLLVDPNGIAVDSFMNLVIIINSGTSSMTVWNGTAMVSEPYTAYYVTGILHEKSKMLVPPKYTLKNFGVAIGFWLDDGEVEKYILSESCNDKIMQIFKNSIIRPVVEENPANQSQEQNLNYIGKYLVGGPRW